MSGKQYLAHLLLAAALIQGKRVVFCSPANTPQEAWAQARKHRMAMKRLGAPTERASYWPSPVIDEPDEPDVFENGSEMHILDDEPADWP